MVSWQAYGDECEEKTFPTPGAPEIPTQSLQDGSRLEEQQSLPEIHPKKP